MIVLLTYLLRLLYISVLFLFSTLFPISYSYPLFLFDFNIDLCPASDKRNLDTNLPSFCNLGRYQIEKSRETETILTMEPQAQLEHVSTYYGETLKTNADLKTSACCSTDAVPPSHRAILAKLHPEVTSRFYGCGSPIPDHLDGTTVLDLGCGTGRDVFVASALVGPSGRVIGVDMTEAQLDIARAHVQFHAKAFFDDATRSNVDFRHGYIEDLHSAAIEDATMDLVISNCVCNLSPFKTKVFAEVFRTLKEGGEFYFSDVYADRRLSEEASKNPVLIGECLGGALYVEDFRRIMADVGFSDIRVVSSTPILLQDRTLLPLVPGVTFYSVTIRAFKASGLEQRREDYGHLATYVPQDKAADPSFSFDVDNVFTAGVATPIDGNTATIFEVSRFRKSFQISTKDVHSGPFTRPQDARVLPLVLDCFRPPLTLASPPASNGCKPLVGACCPPSAPTAKEPCCPPSKPAAKASCCPPSQSSAKKSCCPPSEPAAKSSGCSSSSCKPGSNC